MSDLPESLAGEFWQTDTPERRVSGELRLVGGPVLETLGRLFDERAYVVDVSPRGGVTISHSADPEDVVADWEPRNIHGVLADGTPVSVVGAQGGKKRTTQLFDWEYRQEFGTSRHALLGVHVDEQQVYAGCRFRLDGPNWFRHNDGDAITSDGGRITAATKGAERWLEFIPNEPLTIADFDRWVLNPVETLALLVTTNPAESADLQVRLAADSPWLKVYREEQPARKGSRELLGAEHLTPERYARWIDFRRVSDGLDAAALDDLSGVAIQTTVLALASVAEGLHRRLYPASKRIPALSSADLRQARRAGRGAAVEAVRSADRAGRDPLNDNELAEFGGAISDAFAFVNEATFRNRMAGLVGSAQIVIPDIVAAFEDWPKAVADARNILAHKGTEPHNDTIDQFYDLLIAMSYSLAWVLRTVLLVEAKFDAETLREAYEYSSAYNHHLTNTRNLLKGGSYARQH